jgi:hypothetical protein
MKEAMAVFVAVCLAAGLYFVNEARVARAGRNSVGRVNTRYQMEQLCLQIQTATAGECYLPVETTNAESVAIDAGALLRWVCYGIGSDLITFVPSHNWIDAGRVVDTWGKDIHLTLSRLDSGSATENRFRVKIWSDGPNEKDGGGAGDDVTIPPVEIDIPKWAMTATSRSNTKAPATSNEDFLQANCLLRRSALLA